MREGGNPSSDSVNKTAKESALLSIKVCDVACGSGHILLSAARRIAIELARVRTGEDQPSPEPYRHAIRDVINHCIYGVDKNPLAVELCKVALWLEAYNPGMPLSFLDHRIKCGDSIVGLARIEELQNGIATEAFKTMPDDDKEIAASFRKQNKAQIQNRTQINISDTAEITENLKNLSVKFRQFDSLPDRTVEEVSKKQKEYDVLKGSDWMRLKELADVQVAQFFIPKTNINKDFLTTDAEYLRILAGQKKDVNLRKVSNAMAVSVEKKFFHWFLEFPEVMQEGGFDCIIGNPPFLGNRALSGQFGDTFLNYVKNEFAPAGSCDLVTYFFRRIYELLKINGFQSLISTNTIAQGDAREGGLDVILLERGVINFAIRSMKWPGLAAVVISLITIHKGKWNRERILGTKKEDYISAYLDANKAIGNPFPLKQNANKSFQGSIILGKGFILTPAEASMLISKNPRNKDVLFPYLNGEDLNTNIDQSPSRWVINFFDWDEEYCRTEYPDCFEIVEKLVKPERIRKDESGNFVLRKPLPQKWWIYADKRPALYRTIASMERVIVVAQVSKTVAFSFTSPNQVISMMCIALIINDFWEFSIIQSTLHKEWIQKYASALKSDIRYTPSDVYENYPYPQYILNKTKNELEIMGKTYYDHRSQTMLNLNMGLTKTYNLFHDQTCKLNNLNTAKDIREFKKANLQIPLEKAIKRIEHFRELHKQMDEAVLQAYGWTDINLAHDFYEVDYLPKNDRIRYTISPEARKEILKRLLALNHQIHEEEVKTGLGGKEKTKNKSTPAVAKAQGRLFE